MPSRVLFSSATDNWSTPREVYQVLDAEFRFNDDPCPLNDKPLEDGLARPWGSRTFVNPPFSTIAKWCKKAFDEWKSGKTVVMLMPSRTDTRYWHDYIMEADEIRFIKGRLKFGKAKSPATFGSAIVVFNADKSRGFNK